MFNVLSALTGFRPRLSQETVYRKINDRKLFGPNVQLNTCGVFVRWRIFTTHATFIVYFRSCSMKTSLANDFAVVRLERKRDLFITGIFPARNLFFITVFKLIPEPRRRRKLQSLQFYINSRTIGL